MKVLDVVSTLRYRCWALEGEAFERCVVLRSCSQEASAFRHSERVNAHSVNSQRLLLRPDFGFHLHVFLEARGVFFL